MLKLTGFKIALIAALAIAALSVARPAFMERWIRERMGPAAWLDALARELPGIVKELPALPRGFLFFNVLK